MSKDQYVAVGIVVPNPSYDPHAAPLTPARQKSTIRYRICRLNSDGTYAEIPVPDIREGSWAGRIAEALTEHHAARNDVEPTEGTE